MRRRVLLLAMPFLLAGCGDPPAAGPGGELPPEVAKAIDNQVVESVIVDRDHLYATYAVCEGSECRIRIASTQDGGRTWSHHDMPFDTFEPRKPRVNALVFTLTPIGPRTLRTYQWQGNQAAFVSTDGGATWHRAPRPAAKVDTLPEGWRYLDLGITSVGGADTTIDIGDPATGQIGGMTLPRTIDVAMSGPDLLAPSGLWLAGRARYGLDVEVTFDRGASWQASRLVMDNGGDRTVYHFATTADGRSAYVVTSVFRNQTTDPVSWVHVTTDRGRTWQKIAPTGLPATTRVEDAEMLPDGRLIVLCGLNELERTFHVSADGGRTFTPAEVTGYPARGNGIHALPGGGFTARMPTSVMTVAPPFHLSDDGLIWRQIDVPQV